MEKEEIEEALKVLNSCIGRIKWRLRSSAKRRLETDILALCTGLRPVVMVDYGGKMPELQEHLCTLLNLCHKETSLLHPLRVMIIEDMIYIIHINQLANYVHLSLSLDFQLLFVDLEHDPPKMLLHSEQNAAASQLKSIQKSFSSMFSMYEMKDDASAAPVTAEKADSSKHSGEDVCHSDELLASSSTHFIDLSCCMQDTQVTIPTLNGWLLGYPVVYLFSKEHITNAVYNLSTKPLNIFKVLVGRKKTSGTGPCQEELLSFTVPYDLSMRGENEPWAEAFLTHMQAKFEQCKQSWMYLRMQVSECHPQAIAF